MWSSLPAASTLVRPCLFGLVPCLSHCGYRFSRFRWKGRRSLSSTWSRFTALSRARQHFSVSRSCCYQLHLFVVPTSSYRRNYGRLMSPSCSATRRIVNVGFRVVTSSSASAPIATPGGASSGSLATRKRNRSLQPDRSREVSPRAPWYPAVESTRTGSKQPEHDELFQRMAPALERSHRSSCGQAEPHVRISHGP